MRRRTFIKTSLASGASLALPAMAQAPAVVTAEGARPRAVSGIQIGDVTGDRAIVWSRADRPSRLYVERAYKQDFSDAVRVRGPLALDTTDYTARLDLTGLAADREVFVKVLFEDLSSGKTLSEPVNGRFLTMPSKRRDISFAWSGDRSAWGDCPFGQVAETLKEFRGRYAYNLMDDNVRRLSADVPQIWQWDDHEVSNNWSDSKDVSGDPRYTEKNVPLLVARATRAFLEYAPLRYHGADESERVYRKPLSPVEALQEL